MNSLIHHDVIAASSYRLSAWGWFTMLVSVGFVVGLFGWCIWRVMRESSAQKLHSQVGDIEPPDVAKDE
jgi:flagellar biogenesis protein FliO